jgi:hypothetical protein
MVLVSTVTKPQLKMYITEEMDKALTDAMKRFGMSSRQEVALEVITNYLTLWEQAAQAKANRMAKHREHGQSKGDGDIEAKKLPPYRPPVSKKKEK